MKVSLYRSRQSIRLVDVGGRHRDVRNTVLEPQAVVIRAVGQHARVEAQNPTRTHRARGVERLAGVADTERLSKGRHGGKILVVEG